MISVAAAIIQNDQGQILICQRAGHDSFTNLWEFPGGKQEANETLPECLVRECKEELDIILTVGEFFMEVTHAYPEKTVKLSFYKARIQEGEPQSIVHQQIKWVRSEEIGQYNFCAADEAVVKRIETFV